MSLAVFKPAQVIDFGWEATDREWDPGKLDAVRAITAHTGPVRRSIVAPGPFRSSTKCHTTSIIASRTPTDGRVGMRILEWQFGALYRNCVRLTEGDERKALAKVKQKYFDQFLKTDLHLFLGTTLAWHRRAPNPWTIVGVLPIPHEKQRDLFAIPVPDEPSGKGEKPVSGQSTRGLFDETLVVCGTEFGRTPVLGYWCGQKLDRVMALDVSNRA